LIIEPILKNARPKNIWERVLNRVFKNQIEIKSRITRIDGSCEYDLENRE